MSRSEPATDEERRLLRFASAMHGIPRRAIRCDVYGTVSVVVDERHARNILRRVAPTAAPSAVYDALCVLQDRLAASKAVR